jgi:hypothetical protein
VRLTDNLALPEAFCNFKKTFFQVSAEGTEWQIEPLGGYFLGRSGFEIGTIYRGIVP